MGYGLRPEFASQELAGGGLRDLVEELYVARVFIVGQAFFAELDQLFFRDIL